MIVSTWRCNVTTIVILTVMFSVRPRRISSEMDVAIQLGFSHPPPQIEEEEYS